MLPAVNTTFLGLLQKQGHFVENCQGCGTCVLGTFGGICPVSRCAKSLFNGPCGGSQGGKCEIGGDVPCAWQQIIDRLDQAQAAGQPQGARPPQELEHGAPRRPEKTDPGGQHPVNAMKSNLQRVLEAGAFAVTAECGPPRSADADVVIRKGLLLKKFVDAVNVTDNQTAIVRMSSIAAAAILKSVGVEPVFQMVCRDRNRIALQSDLLGASALGLRNMLCLSGDHQKFGNQAQGKNVFDIDSMQLLRTVTDMTEKGRFIGDEFVMEASRRSSSAPPRTRSPTPSSTGPRAWRRRSRAARSSSRPSASSTSRSSRPG